MELPQPPPDQELKNIIDKLAQFVARNGPEFEHMTKQKQKDNPKFSFLFGGTYFHYYQYRVTSEQAILKQKQRSLEAQHAIVQHAINRQSIQSAPWQQHLHQVQDSVQEQIRQSEQNLAAQHQLLLQQQQVQVDEAIRKAQDEKITSMATEAELDLKELDNILQPIIDSCTKDSISGGKGWIFAHATSPLRSEVIIMYILKRVTAPGATFEAKLRLVYLINDVLHHSNRKNAEDLKKILEKAVVPIFCSTSIGVDSDKQQKLSKLHRLWETNKYFSQGILDQLQNPTTSLAAYQASLIAEHANLITPVTTAVQTQYAQLQKQHQDFVAHLNNQMQQLQQPYGFHSSPSIMMPGASSPFAGTPPSNVGHQSLQPSFEHQNSDIPVPSSQPMVQEHVASVVAEEVPVIPSATQLVKSSISVEDERILPVERDPLAVVEQAFGEVNEGDPRKILKDKKESPDSYTNDFSNPEPSFIDEHSDIAHSDMGRRPDIGGRDLGGRPDVGMRRDISGRLDMGGHSDIDMGLRPHLGGRPSNGQPSHYMDDYSPHYDGPPPYMMDPEYGMTPPHMGYSSHYHDMPPMGLSPHDMPLPPDYLDPSIPALVPPYYDLPAGLMVPLVKLEDTDYDEPLDPEDIVLPAPALPSDRLLAAVEQFYCPPTHERTRNNAYVISSEGWEQLGLYEFFKAKAQAKKQKGMMGLSGDGDELHDFNSPLGGSGMHGYPDKKSPPRRRYREFKSPEKTVEPVPNLPPRNGGRTRRLSRSLSRSRSPSKSPSPDRSKQSPSPPHRAHFQRSSRGRSRSRSPPSPGERRERADRDRDRSPNRSPTPPSFYGSNYPHNPHDRRLDESNKGHQLLKKMGWSGAGGLGLDEQGIEDPVDAGDVRDRQDMYKGVGVSLNDPYENFRKSKGQAFINRMKARAEELGKVIRSSTGQSLTERGRSDEPDQ